MSPAEIEALVEQVGDEILGRLGLPPSRLQSTAAPEAPPSAWPRPQGGYGAAIELVLSSAETAESDVEAACARGHEAGLPVVWTACSLTASAVAALSRSSTRAGALIDFPHGAGSTPARLADIETALRLGAQLVNLVVGAGRLRSASPDAIRTEIRAAAALCADADAGLAVTLEAPLLDERELALAAAAALAGGADALCSSTGQISHAPTSDQPISLLRQAAGNRAAVIAGGPVASFAHAAALIAAGADRIATANPWAILQAAPAD